MSNRESNRHRYIFGDFTLDTRRGVLLKRGAEIKLRPQSFDVLRFLVVQHGNLVSKDELHKEIWGSKVVTDDSITHCLLDIRKALGDKDKKAIRTVPRRGYVLELPCQCEGFAKPEATQARKNIWQNQGMLAIAVLMSVFAILWLFDIGNLRSSSQIPNNSIAILPFADMSERQNQQYLGDGLSNEILNLLSRSSDLRVIARTSSFSFVDKSPDIETIRDSLKVAFVLEGSVRRTGDRLNVTAQLIDTKNNSNVWSERYERHAQELLAIQAKIAEAILWEIAPATDKSVVAPVARNFSANELMYLASYYEHEVRDRAEVDESDLTKSIQLYRDAVEADPNSALAHSRLAGTLLYGGYVKEAEAPTFKALALNPDLSEVQETLGRYKWLMGLTGAGAAWNRAIQLNPNNPDALSAYAYWYWQQGNSEGPESYYRRALELDPLTLSRYADLGSFLGFEGRVDETLEVVERVEEMFDGAVAYRLIARLLELTGRVDEAIAWTIKARNLEPDNSDHIGQLAELYAEIGDFETASMLEPEPSIHLLYRMRRYPEMIELAEELMIEEPDDILVRYMLAFGYSATEQFDAAIRVLRSTGLPETMTGEWKQAINIEALITMANAYDGIGDSQIARQLADLHYSHKHTTTADWWGDAYVACASAILGRDDEALQRLERVATSARLPWYPMLKDSRCFQRYSDEPPYRDALRYTELRQAELFEKLPYTLQAHNVDLHRIDNQ